MNGKQTEIIDKVKEILENSVYKNDENILGFHGNCLVFAKWLLHYNCTINNIVKNSFNLLFNENKDSYSILRTINELYPLWNYKRIDRNTYLIETK